MTPLDRLIRDHIRAQGPLPVDTFMEWALAHPDHGYYRHRDPLGRAGDFTTAPEISQMFGEIIGIWLADRWLRTGQPSPFYLIEAGPGRGTLMADMLRAVRNVPGFMAAARVIMIETSPALRTAQEQALADYARAGAVRWLERLDDVPTDAPLFLVANEFLDALPTRQLVRHEEQWHERVVAVDPADTLVFDRGAPVALPPDAPPAVSQALEGAVWEYAPLREEFVRDLSRRLTAQGGGALLVDYGYEATACGDTLQAVRAHQYAPVLSAVGEADLTSHVDFERLAAVAVGAGAAPAPLLTQGRFLEAMGIHMRAARLRAVATPAQAQEIEHALHRLTAPDAMGTLFKVLEIAAGRPSV